MELFVCKIDAVIYQHLLKFLDLEFQQVQAIFHVKVILNTQLLAIHKHQT